MSENRSSTAVRVINGAFSALAPLAILMVIYAIAGIFPFGDTLLLCEHNSEWFSHLSHYHSALTEGESLFYSFAGGLGGDFYSAFTGGFCNPFWLLTAFYSPDTLYGAVPVIMLIQASAAGLFSYVLFSKLCREQELAAVVFAAAYSGGSLFLLGFLAPQYSGAAVFLPLVGAGLLTLCESGSFVTLFLSMVLFLVSAADLWPCLMLFCGVFFAWGMMTCGDRSQAGPRAALMIVSMGLSIGSAMIFLLPEWLTSVELDAAIIPVGSIDYSSLASLISGLFPGGFSGAECAPMIYCSSMVLFMLAVYFFNSQLGLGERQISGFSLLLILICMAVPGLGWVWLCAAEPTGIVIGSGFVFCLFACTSALRSLVTSIKGNVRLMVLAWLIILLLFLTAVFLRWGEISFELLIFSAASLTLFAAVSLIVLSSRKVSAGFCVVLLLCVCCECILNGVFTFSQTSEVLGLMTVEEYSLRQQQRDWVDGTVASCENGLPSPFFRVRGASSDDYFQTGTDEISTPRAQALMDALGISSGRGYTPFTDALFGVRYVVTGGASEYLYPRVGSDENGAVYMNNASIALGLSAPEGVTGLSSFSANPFIAQNELATALAGSQRQLFNNADILSCTGIGTNVSETLTGTEIIRYDENGYVRFSILAPADGIMYMYVDSDSGSEELVQINNVTTSVTVGAVGQLGYVSRGSTVEVIMTVSDERLNIDGIYFAVLDSALCTAALEEFSAAQPTQLAVNGNYIRGTINIPEGYVLVTSIPYMSGWRANVDGVRVDTAAAAGALLSVEIPYGAHSFELWYEPPYFTASLVISLICFALGMVYACAAEALRRKNESGSRLTAEEQALADSLYISGGYIDEILAGVSFPENEYVPTYANDGVDAEYANAVEMSNPQFLPQTEYDNQLYNDVSAEIQGQLYQPTGVVTDEFQVSPAAGGVADYPVAGFSPEYQAAEYLPDEYYPDELYDPFIGYSMYPQSMDEDDESDYDYDDYE